MLDHHVTARDRLLREPTLQRRARSRRPRAALRPDALGLRCSRGSTSIPRQGSAGAILQYVEDQDLWNWQPARLRTPSMRRSPPIPTISRSGIGSPRARSMSSRAKASRSCARIAWRSSGSLEHARPVALGTKPDRGGERLHESEPDRPPAGAACSLRPSIGASSTASKGPTSSRPSTRSEIVDIAKIAVEYGGGGHKNAAGFRVTLTRWLEEFVL